MEYFFNFDKLGYLKGGKPEGCILCLVAAGSDEVERLVVHESASFVVSLNLYPYNPGHLIVFPEAACPRHPRALEGGAVGARRPDRRLPGRPRRDDEARRL